jgi:CubicO group peptidase (beta-lactamase class C family)
MQVRLPEDVTFGPFRRFGYGLGWYWGEYDGDTLLHHFGSYAGARAHVSFMSRHGLGVAVLLSASGPAADAADLIAISAYDVLLAKPGAEARFDSRLGEAERRPG